MKQSPIAGAKGASLQSSQRRALWGRMRYAIARGLPGLPPAALQRDRMRQVGFDFLLEEEAPTRASQRALRHLLVGLRPSDEILVCSLEVLRMPTGELIALLWRCHQAKTKIWMVSDVGLEDLTTASGPRWLELMARNEQHWKTRASGADPRRRPPQLTRYQLRYARELRRRGESLRSIGLLFQSSPQELLELMDGDPQVGDRVSGLDASGVGYGSKSRPRTFVVEADLANGSGLQHASDGGPDASGSVR